MRRIATAVLGSAALVYACGADPRGSASNEGDAGMATGGAEAGTATGPAEAGMTAGGSSANESSAGAGGVPTVDEAGGAGGTESAPTIVDVPAFLSGTRLRARFYAGSDGSQHLIGFYDTELDLPCEFANLGADGYRCAPLPTQGLDNGFFIDDECMVRATGFLQGCEASTYEVKGARQEVCDAMPRRDVQVVGASHASVFRNESSCQPAVAAPDEVWHALAPADATTFVEGSLETVDLGEGLSLLMIESEEGARAPRSFWFDERPCASLELTGDGQRCAPMPILNRFQFFADDTCTTQVGYTMGHAGCDAPAFLPLRRGMTEPGQCSTVVTTLVEVMPFTSTTVHFLANGVCVEDMVSQAVLTRWEIGSEVDPSALPALTSAPLGNARLQSSALRTANGSQVAFNDGLFDSELQLPCSARLFDDGELRCTPNADYLAGYFSDSSCEVPLHPEPTCSAPRYVVDEVYAEECGLGVSTVRALYRAGAAHQGPVYVSNEEGCNALAVSPGPLVALDLVAPSELVTLTEQVE